MNNEPNHLTPYLSSTMLSAYTSCPELFRRQFIQHWKPKGESVHLVAGGAFAAGLEAARTAYYVEGKTKDEAEAAGLHALLTAYGSFECPEDSAKSASRTAGALEFYFTQYPLDNDTAIPITMPGGRRGIEISFAEPLPINHPETGEPFIYCGRLDMAVNFAGGVFVEDDKTTSQLGALWSKQWDLRSQFTGYVWGLERAAGVKANGVLVRGVSILKTKYDTQQAITYRPQWMVDEWFANLCDTVEDIVRDWKRGWFRKSLDTACSNYGGCPFKQVCMVQDKKPWLDTYFEQSIRNPMTRNEIKWDGEPSYD